MTKEQYYYQQQLRSALLVAYKRIEWFLANKENLVISADTFNDINLIEDTLSHVPR